LDFIASDLLPAALEQAKIENIQYSFVKGNYASGKVSVSGTADTVIPKGTRLQSAEGLVFKTTSNLTLKNDSSKNSVSVQAYEMGDNYNLSKDVPVSLAQAISGVSGIHRNKDFSGGTDPGGDYVAWDRPGSCLSFKYTISPVSIRLPIDSKTVQLNWAAPNVLEIKRVDLSKASVNFSSDFAITAETGICKFLFEDIEEFIARFLGSTDTDGPIVGSHPLNASVEGLTLKNLKVHLTKNASGFAVTEVEGVSLDIGNITILGDTFSDVLDFAEHSADLGVGGTLVAFWLYEKEAAAA